MAQKSTAIFTEYMNSVSPLKETVSHFEPVETAIRHFFDDLLRGRSIPTEEIRHFEKIVTHFNSDNLLSSGELEKLEPRAKQLKNKLAVVEYFSTHFLPDALRCYLDLDAINKKPMKFSKASVENKINNKSHPLETTEASTEISKEFLSKIDRELRPYEAQPPLSMILPVFESEAEVRAFVRPFEERSERAVELNALYEDLARLQAKAGMPHHGLELLLKRVKGLHAEFSRFPSTVRKAIAEGPSHQTPIPPAPVSHGIFSRKPADLTLS